MILLLLLLWKFNCSKIFYLNDTTIDFPLKWKSDLSGNKSTIGKYRNIDEVRTDTFEIKDISYRQNLQPKYYAADK